MILFQMQILLLSTFRQLHYKYSVAKKLKLQVQLQLRLILFVIENCVHIL